MTRTIAADENNDIFIDGAGRLAVAEGLQAVMQAADQAARTVQGEMQYATGQGIPYFDIVWGGGPPNLRQLEAHLRRTLLAVPDVLKVTELTTEQSGDVVKYYATIRTIYGDGTVTNGI